MSKIVFVSLGPPTGASDSAPGGESGGNGRLYQLAEWFGLYDLVAERDSLYKKYRKTTSKN